MIVDISIVIIVDIEVFFFSSGGKESMTFILFLTNNQIETLKRYNINYEISNSLRDLMIKIESVLDYEDIEELENLLTNLTERNYYENTNK